MTDGWMVAWLLKVDWAGWLLPCPNGLAIASELIVVLAEAVVVRILIVRLKGGFTLALLHLGAMRFVVAVVCG